MIIAQSLRVLATMSEMWVLCNSSRYKCGGVV